MNDDRRSQAARKLLALSVCACFALQPIAVPLHLALEDHTHDASPEDAHASPSRPHRHAHGHGHHHAHRHPHGHHGHEHGHHERENHGHESGSTPDDRGLVRSHTDGAHPAHPAVDHLEDVPDPAMASPSVALVAPASLSSHLFRDAPPTFPEVVAPDDTPPPRPPPGALASPRAPPVVA